MIPGIFLICICLVSFISNFLCRSLFLRKMKDECVRANGISTCITVLPQRPFEDGLVTSLIEMRPQRHVIILGKAYVRSFPPNIRVINHILGAIFQGLFCHLGWARRPPKVNKSHKIVLDEKPNLQSVPREKTTSTERDGDSRSQETDHDISFDFMESGMKLYQCTGI